MHIAICDDNVADRKQLERLLSKQGYGFVDSFGSADALLENPRQYDVFFLDMNNPKHLSVKGILSCLEELGVNAPVVLCCSKTNYRIQALPDNLLYLDKPIKSGELKEILSEVQKIRLSLPQPIEIRLTEGTVYLSDSEIIAFEAKGSDIVLHATQNRTYTFLSNMDSFYYSHFENRKDFFVIHKHLVINTAHITGLTFTKVLLTENLQYSHRLKRSKLACYLSK